MAWGWCAAGCRVRYSSGAVRCCGGGCRGAAVCSGLGVRGRRIGTYVVVELLFVVVVVVVVELLFVVVVVFVPVELAPTL